MPNALPACPNDMPTLDLTSVLIILSALAMGGILKGATGAGAPVMAVPVMAAFFDVRLAVAIMVTPSLTTNLWQMIRFWPHRLGNGMYLRFALGGAFGAAIGTAMLATLSPRILTLLVAGAVIAYVGLRLLRPDFRINDALASRLMIPAGAAAGILQGAAGISAPISVSFLNAIRLERLQFIATIAVFFFAMSLVQLPSLFIAGIMSLPLLGLSVLALIPLVAFMPLGAWAARRLSPKGFDRLILVFLSILAVRLIYTSFF